MYHRAATGLRTGSQVYIFPRRTSINGGDTNPSQLRDDDIREIIISPFKPDNWGNIWRLEVSTSDRPGVIRDITKILADRDINIQTQESLITGHEQDFQVSLIANFANFIEDFRVKKHEEDIEAYRKFNTWKDVIVHTFESVNPTIQVLNFQPVRFLFNNSKNQSGDEKNLVDKISKQNYYHDDYKPVSVNEKQIVVSEAALDDVKLFEIAPKSGDIQGTIFSNTEEKFIIVRFFQKQQELVHLEIAHDNQPGAIFHFTRVIAPDDNNAIGHNIVNCYNRIGDDRKRAYWNVLVDVSIDSKKLPDLIANLYNFKYVNEVKVEAYSSELLDKKKNGNIQGLPESEAEKKKEENRRKKEASASRRGLLNYIPIIMMPFILAGIVLILIFQVLNNPANQSLLSSIATWIILGVTLILGIISFTANVFGNISGIDWVRKWWTGKSKKL